MSERAELLLDARNDVGESPIWDVVRQCLWWVDIPGRALWCWDSQTGFDYDPAFTGHQPRF